MDTDTDAPACSDLVPSRAPTLAPASRGELALVRGREGRGRDRDRDEPGDSQPVVRPFAGVCARVKECGMDPYQRKSLPVASSNNDGATFRTADTRARARPLSRDTRVVAPPHEHAPVRHHAKRGLKTGAARRPASFVCLPASTRMGVIVDLRRKPSTSARARAASRLAPARASLSSRTRLARAALAPRSLRITSAARDPLAPRSLHFKVGDFRCRVCREGEEDGEKSCGRQSHGRRSRGRAVARSRCTGIKLPCAGARAGRVAPPPAASRAPLARAPPRTSPHTLAPPWFIQ